MSLKNKFMIILSIAMIFNITTIYSQQKTDFKVDYDIKKNNNNKDEKKSKTHHSSEQVVITGTRTKKLLRKAPVKTEVISRKDIEAKGSENLFQILTGESGINPDNSCLNCGSSDVGLNGLSGNYTQVLFDGIPLLSSLATVYFLQQYPAELVDRVEIVKGGASALYGSGAVGGVINIISRKPNTNRASISYKQKIAGLSWDSFGYSITGFASHVMPSGIAGLAIYGTKKDSDMYDRNKDGISEFSLNESLNFGTNAFWNILPNLVLSVNYSTVNELRRGGDEFDKMPMYTNITEEIDSNRHTALTTLKHEVFADKKTALDYTVFFGFSHLDRTTFYGPTYGGTTDPTELVTNSKIYANSISALINTGLHVNYKFLTLHTMSAGYGFSYEHIEDKNIFSGTYTVNDTYMNHGAYAQYDLDLKFIEIVAGIRGDVHSALNTFIVSPRISIIGNFLNDQLHLRGSFAMGFKAPQVFDEDMHIAVSSGGKQNIISNAFDLKQETSHTGSLDFSGEFKLKKKWYIDFSVGGFITYLGDMMLVEETGNDATHVYYKRDNISGYGLTVGNNYEFTVKYAKMFSFSNGITALYLNRTFNADGTTQVQDWGSSNIARQPNITGSSKIHFLFKDFTADFNIQYLGSQEVVYDEDSGSPKLLITDFMVVLNLKLGYTVKWSDHGKINFYIGVDNILNTYMKDEHITGIADRDPGLVYGPAKPITFYAGLKASI